VDDADLIGQIERAFRPYRFTRALKDLGTPRRRNRRFAMPLAVGATVLVVIVGWAIGTSPVSVSPALAFSDWGPRPDATVADFAAAALTDCHVEQGGRLAVQDQRGSAAVLIYAGGGELTLCLVARDRTGAIVAAASGGSHLLPAPGPLSVDTGLSAPASAQSAGIRIVAGRAAAPVTAVVVTRSDGLQVTATVSSGYWVAWWPSELAEQSVSAMNSAGAVVQVAPGFK
jgi:hypothetical protein